ncbi:CBS domain-containing protein [Desulforhopalus singaporensis]|uniref:CBS domain n=1 Tax=Desulforhopalus singaporensis TaxID=91360 RepID=A0A1H0L4V4_9BACT|nr:CBS domain-containing protein [Desulforhopalus singaporensis]SDO63011.1 CBS domain [Desulforhopalus singaporensis]
MKNILVKELMVPISEYATVEIGTPLIDAIRALEQAQEKFTDSRYQHRAVLVLDKCGNVVGKISQLRALEAIEPEFNFLTNIKELQKFNFSEDYIVELRETYRAREQVINKDWLRVAGNKKVEEFMQAHSAGEYVSEDSDLDTAIHKLVSGRHLSLLVSNNNQITGILRVADVFTAVFNQL